MKRARVQQPGCETSGVSTRAGALRALARRAAGPRARRAPEAVAEGRPAGPAQLQAERVPGLPREVPWRLPAEVETQRSERPSAPEAEEGRKPEREAQGPERPATRGAVRAQESEQRPAR